MAFESFDHKRRAAFGVPVFRRRRRDTGQCRFGRIIEIVHGTRHAQAQRERSLSLDRHISQNVLHQWLLDQPFLKGRPMRCVMQRLHQRLPHNPGRGHGAVKPVADNHLNDGTDTTSFLTHHHAIGVLKLHLGRGVGSITQLVLHPLDKQIVACAVEAPTRNEETGNPHAVSMGQHQKRIAHWGRAEELVPGQKIAITRRYSHGRIGSHIRSALFFGHEHTNHRAGFFLHWNVAPVILRGHDARQPFLCHDRRHTQRRDNGVGHSHRAHHAALGLAEHIGQDRLAHMPCIALIMPGEIVHFVGNREVHQIVVGRMKLNRIDPHAVTIKRPQFWAVAIGLTRLLKGLIQSGQLSSIRQMVSMAGAALNFGPMAHRPVILPEVLIPHMRRHIDNLVGWQLCNRFTWFHSDISLPAE